MQNLKFFLKYLYEVLTFWKNGFDWLQLILTIVPILYSSTTIYLNQFNSSTLLTFTIVYLLYSTFRVYLRHENVDIKVDFKPVELFNISTRNKRIDKKEILISFYINNPNSYDIFLEKILPDSKDLTKWFGDIAGSEKNLPNFYPYKIKAGDTEYIKRYLKIETRLDLSSEKDIALYDTNILRNSTPNLNIKCCIKNGDKEEFFNEDFILKDFFKGY